MGNLDARASNFSAEAAALHLRLFLLSHSPGCRLADGMLSRSRARVGA